MPLVENQLEKRTTPYIPSFFHCAWARLFTTEAQSTGAPFHPKHTAQPAEPLSLSAGPASTAVIILRAAQVESDCREIPPPLPVLKSFTLPQVNQLISLPISELFWLCSCRPRSHSSLQQPAAPAQRLPSSQHQARAFYSRARRFPHSPCALGKQQGADHPRCRRKQGISQLCCKSQAQREGSGESELLHTLVQSLPKPRALIQAQQDAAGEQGARHDSRGAPQRGDKQAAPFPAG